MKKLFATALLTIMPVIASADHINVNVYEGEAKAPKNPEKVIALDLAAIDGLSALGVTIAGKPDITPPAYLADYLADVPAVGTLFEPDFELIASMQPDLIIAGGRSQKQVEPLSAIAPTLDMTIWGGTIIEDAKARLTTYGQIFDKTAEADALNAELDAAVANARALSADKGNALILLTTGGKVSAYGQDSRFGWLHTALGIAEAFPDLNPETHGEAVSFEFIAEVNPDWILVVDRDAAIGQEGEAASATLDNPLVAGTTAGKKGQIIYLDSSRLYLAGGGIQSVMGTIEEITTAMSASGEMATENEGELQAAE